MKKDISTINEIMKVIGKSGLTEMCIEENGFKLFIKKPKLVSVPGINKIEEIEDVVEEIIVEEFEEIISENVGRFYSLDEEGNFMLETGMKIKKGQNLGYVEAIGLKTDIISEVEGTIKEVLVSNGEIAEYGKVLVRVAK